MRIGLGVLVIAAGLAATVLGRQDMHYNLLNAGNGPLVFLLVLGPFIIAAGVGLITARNAPADQFPKVAAAHGLVAAGVASAVLAVLCAITIVLLPGAAGFAGLAWLCIRTGRRLLR
jgi:hypothetical protein